MSSRKSPLLLIGLSYNQDARESTCPYETEGCGLQCPRLALCGVAGSVARFRTSP